MTKKEIIDMARKAGGIDLTNTRANVTVWVGTGTFDFLVAFAKLTAEKEREACAKVCEENATDLSEGDWDSACNNCADLIRARGQE